MLAQVETRSAEVEGGSLHLSAGSDNKDAAVWNGS